MQKLTVSLTPSYDIFIGGGLLSTLGERVKALLHPQKVMLVSDDTVFSLYGETAKASLESAGLDVVTFVFPHGEASKNAETLLSLVNESADQKLTRTDCMVALGGGVVGDLTGFAASCYLRGIPFVQIPTTLLAAVDSSVGGKTAIDLPAGKNLMGSFYQPSLVLCDTDTLSTLPKEIWADGYAEVIKYGVMIDEPFFSKLENRSLSIEAIIARCVAIKSEIVAEDEKDTGRRRLLNLGHTVGHGIERLSDFSVSHGSAVAMGMMTVTRAAVLQGLCPKEDALRLKQILQAYHLPTDCPYTIDTLLPVMLSDKKRTGDTLSFVVPHGIGDSRIEPVPVEALKEFLAPGLEEK